MAAATAIRTHGAETAQTLSRGLDVLKLVAAARSGLTLGDLATTLGLSRTVVYRLVATLVEHRLVHRSADGVLRVGLGALGLTANIAPMLRDAARESLVRIAADVNATVHLSIVDGRETVAVEVVEPLTTSLHIAYRVGSRLPLTSRGHGRAVLNARRGRWDYVVSKGELIAGVYGVSAAVPNLPDIEAVVGVISIAPLDVHAVGTRVQAAVEEIAAAL